MVAGRLSKLFMDFNLSAFAVFEIPQRDAVGTAGVEFAQGTDRKE